MPFKKILFHTHFREFAFNSLKSVLELRHIGLEEVVLTFIIPHDEVAFVPYGGYLKEKETQLQHEAHIRFEDWEPSIAELGIKTKIRIATGEATSELLAIAEAEGVDLIVTGPSKRTLLEKVYVGGHILDILRRSQVPVLMGKYHVEYESGETVQTRINEQIFKRPMLASDWSQPAEHALQSLLELKGLADKIILTHVIDAKIAKGLEEPALKELEQESRKRLEARSRAVSEADMAAEFHLAMGKTVPELIRISREHEATLIVLGRTGKDWIEEYWLGGVSHRVAELSELPVLLVP